jgi:hypothetical protein
MDMNSQILELKAQTTKNTIVGGSPENEGGLSLQNFKKSIPDYTVSEF